MNSLACRVIERSLLRCWLRLRRNCARYRKQAFNRSILALLRNVVNFEWSTVCVCVIELLHVSNLESFGAAVQTDSGRILGQGLTLNWPRPLPAAPPPHTHTHNEAVVSFVSGCWGCPSQLLAAVHVVAQYRFSCRETSYRFEGTFHFHSITREIITFNFCWRVIIKCKRAPVTWLKIVLHPCNKWFVM